MTTLHNERIFEEIGTNRARAEAGVSYAISTCHPLFHSSFGLLNGPAHGYH